MPHRRGTALHGPRFFIACRGSASREPRPGPAAPITDLLQRAFAESAFHRYFRDPTTAPDSNGSQRGARANRAHAQHTIAVALFAIRTAVRPAPIGEVVDVPVIADHDETGRNQLLVATFHADSQVVRRVEVAEPQELFALRAGVVLGKAMHPHTVVRRIRVLRGRQPKVVDPEELSEPALEDLRRVMRAPRIMARDDERLVLDSDHRADAVGGDKLGPAGLTEFSQCPAWSARAPSSCRWRHRRVPPACRNRVASASTSRRLHGVGQPSSSS